MPKLNRDRVAGLIILLVCTWLFYEASLYPFDSRVFPVGLLIFMMICAIIMIARPAGTSGGQEGNPKKVLITILLCLAYVLIVDVLGYFLASALFMAVFMAMMGLRNPLVYIAAIAGVNLCLYLIFVWQLKVPVPSGILFR